MKKFENELKRVKEIEIHLKNLTDTSIEMSKNITGVDEKFAKQITDLLGEMERIKVKISNDLPIDFEKMVDEKLEVYSNDRTNRMDYALSSLGSSIVASSETYTPFSWKDGLSAVMSYINTDIPSPSYVLEPSTTPGHCWPFPGSNGFIVVKLFTPIIPGAFSIDHISSVSRPKTFQVIGFQTLQTDGDLLGEFTFGSEKTLQTFEITPPVTKRYQFYKLNITSNHGNPLFTCLYRFRVHGQ